MRRFFRRPRFRIFLIVTVCFAAAPLFADTAVQHGRLRFALPGSWSLKSGATLEATSRSTRNTRVLVVSPVAATTSADAFLRKGVAGFEKNRRIVKTFPASPRAGKTRGGLPFSFWGVTSQGSRGDTRYGAFYVFQIGRQFQTVILLSGSEAGFRQTMKPLGEALDRVAIVGGNSANVASNNSGGSSGGSARGTIRPLRGKGFAYYDHVLPVPRGWKAERGRIGGERFFQANAQRSGFTAVGGKDTIQVAVEIQPVGATDPLAALKSYLNYRADLGLRGLRPGKMRGWKIYGQRNETVNGARVVGMVMEHFRGRKDDDRFLVAGAAVVRPDGQSTLLIGSALKIYAYYNLSYPPRVNADRRHWANQWYGQLLGMAAGVKWTSLPAVDAAGGNFLAQKRTLRYNRSNVVNSGSVSAMFSTKADWNFGAGGTVQYKVERVRSFLDNSYDLYGRPDFSSGYAGNNRAGGRQARYEVRRSGRAQYLLVYYPSGAGSVHDLSPRPFAIDGLKDGCCR